MVGKASRAIVLAILLSVVVLSTAPALGSDDAPLTAVLDAITALGDSLVLFAERLETVGFDPEILFSGAADIKSKLATTTELSPSTDVVPPGDWAAFLSDLTEKVDDVGARVKAMNPDVPAYITLLTEAKALVDRMEEALSDDPPYDDELHCPNGRLLVVVYPGFTCEELIQVLDERLAEGWCIIVRWSEYPAGDPRPYDPSDPPGPTQWRLYDCLEDYPLSPVIQVQAELDPNIGFRDTVELGNPSLVPHESIPPIDPHPAYGTSTLPEFTDPDEPRPDGWFDQFGPGETVETSVDVTDLCERAAIRWEIYDPVGSPVSITELIVDPSEDGVPCLSAYQALVEIDLDPFQFGPPGAYAAELWINDTFSALHALTIAPPPPTAPIVMDETYWLGPEVQYAGTSVLSNDFDPNHQPLLAEIDTSTQFGDIELVPDGTFTYQPGPGFVGMDMFTYTATDPDGMSGTGTVTLVVGEIEETVTTDAEGP